MAQFPFFTPLASSLSVSLPLSSPSPSPPHSLPIPNSQHPRSIVRLTKMTSRSRLLMVRNIGINTKLSALTPVFRSRFQQAAQPSSIREEPRSIGREPLASNRRHNLAYKSPGLDVREPLTSYSRHSSAV